MSAGESKTFTAELAGGTLAGTSADVTVTVEQRQGQGAARARRRLRAVRQRVRHPRRAAGRDPGAAGDDAPGGPGRPGPGAGHGRPAGQDRHPAAGGPGQARDREPQAVAGRAAGPVRQHAWTSYLEATSQTAEDLDEQFAEDARRSVKAGFVLDKLAADEELGVDQNELTAYLTEQAYRMGVSPDRLAKELSDRGQLGSRRRRRAAVQGPHADRGAGQGHRRGRARRSTSRPRREEAEAAAEDGGRRLTPSDETPTAEAAAGDDPVPARTQNQPRDLRDGGADACADSEQAPSERTSRSWTRVMVTVNDEHRADRGGHA